MPVHPLATGRRGATQGGRRQRKTPVRQGDPSASPDEAKITRGPKPVRALREIGLASDLQAVEPTTEGIIAALTAFNLPGRTVGVQLYGDELNIPLMNFGQAQKLISWHHMHPSRR